MKRNGKIYFCSLFVSVDTVNTLWGQLEDLPIPSEELEELFCKKMMQKKKPLVDSFIKPKAKKVLPEVILLFGIAVDGSPVRTPCSVHFL